MACKRAADRSWKARRTTSELFHVSPSTAQLNMRLLSAAFVLLPIVTASPAQYRFIDQTETSPSTSRHGGAGSAARGDWRLEPVSCQSPKNTRSKLTCRRTQGYTPSSLGRKAPELNMPGGFSRNIPEVSEGMTMRTERVNLM